MKKLLRICAVCAAVFALTSCAKPYYQMVSVKPTDQSLLKSGENGLYYEDDSILVEYDLFYDNDKIAYIIYNKTDEVLWMNKKASFAVDDLKANDNWNFDKILNDDLYDYFITIPPHAYKTITTSDIIGRRFVDPKLKDNPKRKHAETVSYTQENTPGVMGNYIAYKFGENGANQGVGLYFYVSKVTNYHKKDFYKNNLPLFTNPHKYPTCVKHYTAPNSHKNTKKVKSTTAPNNAMYLMYYQGSSTK